ncbi:MAG: hypothetical protein LBS72_09055 [Oscillospiraceae bacterium]|nr:hypothetical protein [Oscillospiraceae bacterium]
MKKDQIREINDKLQVVVDQPLRAIFRWADMLGLEFGNIIEKESFGKKEDGTRGCFIHKAGEYALHIQTFYRLVSGNAILLAKNDLYQPSNKARSAESFDRADFDCELLGNNRLDEIMYELAGNLDGFVVKSVSVNNFGDLRIRFNNAALLQVIADTSDAFECWRFFRHGDESDHLVVSTDGILG